MKQELLIDAVPGELRAALLEDGTAAEVSIDRQGHRSVVGNIYLGRVEAVEPSLQAAFISLPEGPPGYLPLKYAGALIKPDSNAPRRIERILHQGQSVIVEATRDAVGDKGPGLTSLISLPGRRLVYQPFHQGTAVSGRIRDTVERTRLESILAVLGDSAGRFLARTAAKGADASVLHDEAADLRAAWNTMSDRARQEKKPVCLYQDLPPLERALRDWVHQNIDRIVLDGPAELAAAKRYLAQHMPGLEERVEVHVGLPPLFEARGVEEAIDSTLAARIDMPGGGWITIETTEALTAIDVNSGDETSHSDREQTGLAVNLRAVPLIARQLRLRDIGGMIAIDFIYMESLRHREQVLATLRRAFDQDRTPVAVLGFSRMGLCELTRRRSRTTLPDLLAGPHHVARERSIESVGYDVMRAIRAEAAARPVSRLNVDANPDVADWLAQPGRREALEELAGVSVILQARPDLSLQQFEVYGDERHG